MLHLSPEGQGLLLQLTCIAAGLRFRCPDAHMLVKDSGGNLLALEEQQGWRLLASPGLRTSVEHCRPTQGAVPVLQLPFKAVAEQAGRLCKLDV